MCLGMATSVLGQVYEKYTAPEGYPDWVAVRPVDPETLVPTKVVGPGDQWSKVIAEAQPGDVIALEDGVYEGSLAVYDRAAPSAPVTVMALHSRKAVLDAEGGDPILSTYPHTVPASYWRFIGLCLVNADKRNAEFANLRHVTFQDCEFANTQKRQGLLVESGEGLVVSGCYFHHNAYGLQVGVKDQSGVKGVLIENCVFDSNAGKDLSNADGVGVENAVLTRDVLIRDCVSTRHSDAGFDVKPEALILRCLSRQNSGPGFKIWRSVEMRNCLAYSNREEQIELAGATLSTYRRILGCTVVAPGSTAIAVKNLGSFAMRNTIVDGRVEVATEGALDVDYCLFTQAPGPWQGQHSIVGNPMFVDPANGGYHLRQGSAAIGIGEYLPLLSPDLELKVRRQPFCAGCYDRGVEAGRH